MSDDPRAALDRFMAALEAHFHAVTSRRGDDDPGVDDAYDVLADAFEFYEDALARVHEETLPFLIPDEDDDTDDESDLDESDEDDLDVEDDLIDGTELDDVDS